ncbi:methyltransferase [Sphingobium bisphenolivorans]|uniref:methyltransferase n=1 Tax=Sphingobium bisphenolivorans TaxID=1335760 RepID=UPI001EE6FCDE|nr:class I SAM-dependent methyltransferase [Sphingobium bisphenolivorans]
MQSALSGGGEWAEGGAIAALLEYLKERDYRFVTPTPATHARILTREGGRQAENLRDIFGWSLPFDPRQIDPVLWRMLEEGRLVERHKGGAKSRVRVSSLGDDLFLHSAYPTTGQDAVFFGPDSYRFARLIADELGGCPRHDGGRLVDIGTGAGVGAIVAAHLRPSLQIAMTDINPVALRLAEVNARAAGVKARFFQTGDISSLEGNFDLILANPPYIADNAGRSYRDGGDLHGGEVSLEMARQAVPRLAAGGRFILYTGSAIVAGEDRLHQQLASLAQEKGCRLRYAEIDPDVFGEELEGEAYRHVERIALVSAIIGHHPDSR